MSSASCVSIGKRRAYERSCCKTESDSEHGKKALQDPDPVNAAVAVVDGVVARVITRMPHGLGREVDQNVAHTVCSR